MTSIKFVQASLGTFDGILDTVSAMHSILPLIGLLKSHGKLVTLGAPEKPLELPVFPLLMGNFNINLSLSQMFSFVMIKYLVFRFVLFYL